MKTDMVRIALALASITLASAFSPSPMGLSLARAPALRASPASRRLSPLSMQLENLDSRSPQACHDLCKQDGYVYLDVRTDEEFAAGSPEGSVNVPAFAKTDDGMFPMSSVFLKLVGINFPDKENVKIVVGCQAGNRSKSACMWLSEAGYKNIVENESGYSGWTSAGLPTE